MENSNNPTQAAEALFSQAVTRIGNDMQAREIGAILWNNSTAGFHYIPEISIPGKDGKTEIVRIMGLYLADNALWLVEEGKAPVELTEFYTDGVEVPPVVVTLSEDSARRYLGDPKDRDGYTAYATNEEWLTIADCYFEALAEE